MRFFEIFGKAFVFKSIRPKLRQYLQKAGIYKEIYDLFGILFFVSAIFGIIIHFILVYPLIISISPILIGFVTFFSFSLITFLIVTVIILLVYFYLDVVIFQRINQMEKVLPEYLQVVSTNVKSGMPIDKSLWRAIRPRFGILAFEMEIILKRVMTGHDLEDAIRSFVDKFNSPTLNRSFGLLLGELDSGGKISHILDDVVKNLKNTQKMKAELAASVITYMIFIGTIVIVISPALFALSFNLLTFMDSMINRVAQTGVEIGGFAIGSSNIDLDLFRLFSFSAVIIVAFLSSLIISIIERGNIKAGLKYIPIFVIGSVFSYVVFSIVLQAIFGNIVI